MNYLLISNLVFSLLVALYLIQFKSNSFYQINRAYLLSSLLISIVFPLIPSPQFAVKTVPQIASQLPVYQVGQAVAEVEVELPFLFIAYLVGAISFGLIFGFRLLKAARVALYSDDYLVDNEHTAFSFFKKLIVGNGFDNEQRKMIQSHESVHAAQWHSVDIMLYELAVVVFWFNPLIHLARKEVSLNHEFIADKHSLQRYGTDYQYTLLNQALHTKVFPLTNSFFNQSFIKQRIMKMNQKRSSKRALLNYAMLVPVFALAFGVNACNEQAGIPNEVSKKSALNETMSSTLKEEKVLKMEDLDVKPQYEGGTEAFYAYLGEAVKYPEELKELNLDAQKVFVEFVITEEGAVKDVQVLKSDDDRFNQAAIAAVEGITKYEPGMKNGKPVSAKMVLPFKFALN
jgi:TonB family protein